jgi:hypothetical protein
MFVWSACNLTSFSPCLTGPVDYLFASRHKGHREYLCETGILLLAMSCYIDDPDVIDHFCGFVWGGLRPETSLGLRADNVIIPLDLIQLFCPGFTLAAGPPSSFTTDGVSCWGGALWRACNLTSFSPCLTGPVDYLVASHHTGPRFKSPGGNLCKTGILLLALSHYICMFLIQHKIAKFLKHQIWPFSWGNLSVSQKWVFLFFFGTQKPICTKGTKHIINSF